MAFGSNKRFEKWVEERFRSFHISLIKSFGNIKRDFNKINSWIYNVNTKGEERDKRIKKIEENLEGLRILMESFDDKISAVQDTVQNKKVFGQLSKRPVQNELSKPVQTGRKLPKFFERFSVMERVIIFGLLNSDMKLSYDDLAVLTGKDPSTLRGQINSIKTKSGGLISESTEARGKKRFYIEERKKSEILKKNAIAMRARKKRSK